jgi:predicted outer membrane repeat protein
VGAGTYKESIAIDRDVMIRGEDQATTIVDANQRPFGFRISSATVTIKNVTIRNGFSVDGGGIVNAGTLTLMNTTISGNEAQRFGGGILNVGVLTIKNSAITGNTTVDQGGGIANLGGNLTIRNSIIEANHTVEFGGGVYSAGVLLVQNSTIADNKAGAGGGIYATGQVTLTHVTFENNTPTDCTGCP